MNSQILHVPTKGYSKLWGKLIYSGATSLQANEHAARIAYAVTIVSTGLYLYSSLINVGYYSYGYYDLYLLLRNILYSAGIGGMVVGPYFGVAALIAKKDESVWALVNRLIHGHISVPFIGGLSLAWGGAFTGFGASFYQGIVIVPYTVFVFLGTLINLHGWPRYSDDNSGPRPQHVAFIIWVMEAKALHRP